MLTPFRRALRLLIYGKPVIVVSGLPRSGTSMAMKMLAAAGVPVVEDGERTADEDNPRGYFEDERVKELAETEDKAWLAGSRGRAVKVISYLLKDLPRTNNYRVVFLHRHLREVLASQAKMLARRDEVHELRDEQMLEIYQDHLWRVDYLFRHAPHLERLELLYSDVVTNPRREAERIAAFIGGLDIDRMVSAVDGGLYRNRFEAGSNQGS